MIFPTNPHRGLFIALEGIDGCGKTLQAQNLAAAFRERILATYEPWWEGSRSPLDEKLREGLRGNLLLSAEDIQRLMVENRRRHFQELLLPTLQRGDRIVLTDRYCFSTFAYGEATTSLSFDELIALHRKLIADFFLPDLTLIFDLPVSVALARLAKDRAERHVFEKGETLERVREAYLSFPQRFAPAEVYLIDATRSPEDVFTESRSFIEAAVARKWGRTSFR